jgi:probable phosphoglycerate mutase
VATRLALDAPRTWPLGNAAVNRLLYADQGLMLVGWGDSRHLAPPDADASTR